MASSASSCRRTSPGSATSTPTPSRTRAGFTLVDPGLPSDESWAALQQRLAAAGIPLKRVHTTFITHSHPDHFGGAHKLVEEANTRS